MNIWHDIKADLVRREEYTAVTVNAMGSTAVMEFDGETGLLRLEHMNDPNMGAANNTGFIPRTMTQTGVPVETVLLCSQPIPPMTLVRCRPVGLITLHPEQGEEQNLILSAVCADDFWGSCLTIDEIPAASRKAMVRFLRYSRQVVGNPASSIELFGLEKAEEYFDLCAGNYLLRYCGSRP